MTPVWKVPQHHAFDRRASAGPGELRRISLFSEFFLRIFNLYLFSSKTPFLESRSSQLPH